MLDYPIGTFLFWRVKKRIVNQKEYSMYDSSKIFMSAMPTKIHLPLNRFQQMVLRILFGLVLDGSNGLHHCILRSEA